jgi:hypothetical protein
VASITPATISAKAAFACAPRKHRTAVQVAAGVAVLAILVLLVIYRSHEPTSLLSPGGTTPRCPPVRARSQKPRRYQARTGEPKAGV